MFLEQLDIIDCISKYLLIEKMAFRWYLIFVFMMHNFPLYFLCQFPLNFFDYNNILIFMKKDAEHISVNAVKTFSYYTNNGFTCIMSEAAVTSFPSYSFSEHFRKYPWKITACGNFTFNWILTLKTSLLCLLIQLTNYFAD